MLPLTFPSPPPVPALFRWQWVVTLRRLYTQREGRMSPPWGLGNCRTPLSPFHLSSSSTSLPSFWSLPHQAPPRNHRDLVSTLSTIPTTSTCSPGVPALHPSHYWLPGSRRKWTLWIRRYPKLSGQGSQGGAMMGSGKGQAIKVQDVSLRSTTAWTLRANELCCYNGPYPGLTTHVGTPLRCARPWKAVPSAVRSLLASCHEATSLQQQSSPRGRKKKMSPPCISVDPPEGSELPEGFHPALGMVPPPLPSRDTCLRRRAPSSDSKDSFDLGGGGDGLPQEGIPNTKLLTLPSFSFEKTSSEHWTLDLLVHTHTHTHTHTHMRTWHTMHPVCPWWW